MKAKDIRSRFLQYFEAHGHTAVESSSLIPANDPTLLFTNAGMNQFKDVFLGKEKRSYVRAVSSQKCVRAGGKHNDLENVGHTARHHTFFEMLGNFSFGDYFKKEAIHFGWEFVTKELKIPQDKLYVSVFLDDDEAAELWERQEGVPKERIYRFGEKDNFWSMGDTGPCGPCSEIFVDRGKKYGCGKPDCQVGCECDRFMEIWNLVFMQFDRDSKGKLHPLPKPSVDTGAGLERLASVLQNVDTNYDTDLFQEIIKKTESLCKVKYQSSNEAKVSFRVISDHARASTFLIGDGVLPSNEGRGYVLRRIIRRAIRHGSKLGFEDLFLDQVCNYVIQQMSDAYPDLIQQKEFILKAVRSEEAQFRRTLDRGLELLDQAIQELGGKKTLSGSVAFKLYDTYGFPLDLTKVILAEKNLTVDENEFEKCMEKQRSESRKHWKGSGETEISSVYFELEKALSSQKKTPKFTGYYNLSETSPCVALIVDGKLVQSFDSQDFQKNTRLEAVFAVTPFYGESGGQVGDQGMVENPDGFKAQVLDTQKPVPQLTTLVLKPTSGTITVGKEYSQTVDRIREFTQKNHTATHLLHWALGKVLGKHIKQAGSLVTPDLLRFDFTHFQPVSPQEIEQIETLINDKIWRNDPVTQEEMPKDKAIEKGAIAFFGEKYGDVVRVIQVGDFSTELCGGTHVDRSSDIHLFKVVSESSIAAGVRRIVAYTSKGAFDFLREQSQQLTQIKDRLKASSDQEVIPKIEKLFTHEKSLKREIEKYKSQSAGNEVQKLLDQATRSNGYTLVSSLCPFDPQGIKRLREISDQIQQKEPGAVTILGMNDSEKGKAMILVSRGPKAPNQIDANQLIKEVSPLIDGRGGGKPNLAQAGGSKLSGLQQAIQQATQTASNLLKS